VRVAEDGHGLAPLAKPPPRRAARSTCPQLQRLRRGQPHDALGAGAIEEVQDPGRAEAAVESHAQARLGKGGAELRWQPREDRDETRVRRAVVGPQHRAQQVLLDFVVEGDRPHKRPVAVGGVVAVEEAELLLAVGRVVGWIGVERDPPERHGT
jgi:hypothetical protein